MANSSRSLADDIRGRSDAELIDLVLARPDLARPAPADLTSLAARAGTRASVQRAVEALDRGHLQVLEAVVVAGDAARRDALLALLGTEDAATVETILQDLWRSALLWRGADGDHVVRTVPEVLGSSVAGLGAPMRELRPSSPPEQADADHIRATLDEAPDEARAMLQRMTWGPAFGVLPTNGPGHTTARWLLEHHLLVPVSVDRVAHARRRARRRLGRRPAARPARRRPVGARPARHAAVARPRPRAHRLRRRARVCRRARRRRRRGGAGVGAHVRARRVELERGRPPVGGPRHRVARLHARPAPGGAPEHWDGPGQRPRAGRAVAGHPRDPARGAARAVVAGAGLGRGPRLAPRAPRLAPAEPVRRRPGRGGRGRAA